MLELNEILGERIRSLRRARDMSQEALAEQADLSIQQFGAIERGTANPTLTSLAKIAKALGVSLFELFDTEHLRMEPDLMRGCLLELLSKADDKKIAQAYRLITPLFE